MTLGRRRGPHLVGLGAALTSILHGRRARAASVKAPSTVARAILPHRAWRRGESASYVRRPRKRWPVRDEDSAGQRWPIRENARGKTPATTRTIFGAPRSTVRGTRARVASRGDARGRHRIHRVLRAVIFFGSNFVPASTRRRSGRRRLERTADRMTRRVVGRCVVRRRLWRGSPTCEPFAMRARPSAASPATGGPRGGPRSTPCGDPALIECPPLPDPGGHRRRGRSAGDYRRLRHFFIEGLKARRRRDRLLVRTPRRGVARRVGPTGEPHLGAHHLLARRAALSS